MRHGRLLTLVAALASFAVLSAPPAAMRAAAATPTPTPTPIATPFPPGATTLRVQIVNDLNGDGARDGGESGVAGWRVYLGCGDAFASTEPTDARGVVATTLLNGYSHDGVTRVCAHIERPLGWLPTSPWWQTADIPNGAERNITFMVHDLGRNVMEAAVSVVVRGIPASDPHLTLAPPFDRCAERIEGLPGLLIIVDGRGRTGCPSGGDALTILVDGQPAGTLTFAPGTRAFSLPTLVIGGDSMRFFVSAGSESGTWEVDGARIDGHECAVVQRREAFPPGISIYVLSDEARPGCGRPGSTVRLYRNGAPLAPVLSWQPGWVAGDIAVALEGLHVITPPNTGDGAAMGVAVHPRNALILATVGIFVAAAGLAVRRSKPFSPGG